MPEPLLKAFATATDHAMVRPAGVHYDHAGAVVSVPIRLAKVPSRSWLRELGFWFARGPRAGTSRSRLVVRQVTTCQIDVLDVEPASDEVQLIFGITIDGNRLFASSAEETRGRTLFNLDVTFSTLDIELATDPDITQQR